MCARNAADRLFTCNAIDSFDRKSNFEINVDSGAIKMKASSGHEWKVLYANRLNCGLKTPASVICRRQLIHNFDNPQRPYEAVTDTIRCHDKSGRPLIDLNGTLEINRFGDRSGLFVCGQ